MGFVLLGDILQSHAQGGDPVSRTTLFNVLLATYLILEALCLGAKKVTTQLLSYSETYWSSTAHWVVYSTSTFAIICVGASSHYIDVASTQAASVDGSGTFSTSVSLMFLSMAAIALIKLFYAILTNRGAEPALAPARATRPTH